MFFKENLLNTGGGDKLPYADSDVLSITVGKWKYDSSTYFYGWHKSASSGTIGACSPNPFKVSGNTVQSNYLYCMATSSTASCYRSGLEIYPYNESLSTLYNRINSTFGRVQLQVEMIESNKVARTISFTGTQNTGNGSITFWENYDTSFLIFGPENNGQTVQVRFQFI